MDAADAEKLFEENIIKVDGDSVSDLLLAVLELNQAVKRVKECVKLVNEASEKISFDITPRKGE